MHDVYSYNGNSRYAGLLVEIQYRTLIQHSWATAVEIMGFVTDNNLKFGQGDKRWLEIFRFASEILARVFEGRKSCLGNLADSEIIEGFDRLVHHCVILEMNVESYRLRHAMEKKKEEVKKKRGRPAKYATENNSKGLTSNTGD